MVPASPAQSPRQAKYRYPVPLPSPCGPKPSTFHTFSPSPSPSLSPPSHRACFHLLQALHPSYPLSARVPPSASPSALSLASVARAISEPNSLAPAAPGHPLRRTLRLPCPLGARHCVCTRLPSTAHKPPPSIAASPPNLRPMLIEPGPSPSRACPSCVLWHAPAAEPSAWHA